MSTAGEEHHRSHGTGYVLMALLAFALATIAAYLWLSDGNLPWRAILRAPATSSAHVAPAMGPSMATPARTVLARPARRPQPNNSAATAPQVEVPADQSQPVDAQVAADAAAVGMTSRVRPSEPAAPGQ